METPTDMSQTLVRLQYQFIRLISILINYYKHKNWKAYLTNDKITCHQHKTEIISIYHCRHGYNFSWINNFSWIRYMYQQERILKIVISNAAATGTIHNRL